MDGESSWDKNESHQRYGYAKPTLKACLDVLLSPDYTDGMLACLCNLNSNQVETLRFQVREELREDCPRPARVVITSKNGELLCRRGDTPEMRMLRGCTEHKLEFNDVRNAFKEDP